MPQRCEPDDEVWNRIGRGEESSAERQGVGPTKSQPLRPFCLCCLWPAGLPAAWC